MKRRTMFILLIMSVMVSCQSSQTDIPSRIYRLQDKTIVVFKDQHLYKIDPMMGALSSELKYSDVVLAGNTVGIIRDNGYYRLDLSQAAPTQIYIGKGSLLDTQQGRVFVKDKDYLRVYSNDNQINFIPLEDDYQKAEIWNERILVSLNKGTIQFWDILKDGSLQLKNTLKNIQDFSLNPEQPIFFLIQNTNEIYSYQPYAAALTLIDKMPFPVLGIDYHDPARMLMVKGPGVMAFYHMDSKRIEMGQMEILDMFYDGDQSELLVLSSNKITIIDFTTKSNINEYALN